MVHKIKYFSEILTLFPLAASNCGAFRFQMRPLNIKMAPLQETEVVYRGLNLRVKIRQQFQISISYLRSI